MAKTVIYEMMRAMPVFKPEMRKANRDGIKSRTRRVIDPQIEDVYWNKRMNYASIWNPRTELTRFCPYGKAGTACYMREPLVHGFGGVAYYKDDEFMVRHALTGEPITWRWKKDVLPSIFMPKEAARSIYRYTDIRVERVQEISERDAILEGVAAYTLAKGVISDSPPDPRWKYIELWNEINARRGYAWKSNPWVWVLAYEPVEVRGG